MLIITTGNFEYEVWELEINAYVGVRFFPRQSSHLWINDFYWRVSFHARLRQSVRVVGQSRGFLSWEIGVYGGSAVYSTRLLKPLVYVLSACISGQHLSGQVRVSEGITKSFFTCCKMIPCARWTGSLSINIPLVFSDIKACFLILCFSSLPTLQTLTKSDPRNIVELALAHLCPRKTTNWRQFYCWKEGGARQNASNGTWHSSYSGGGWAIIEQVQFLPLSLTPRFLGAKFLH